MRALALVLLLTSFAFAQPSNSTPASTESKDVLQWTPPTASLDAYRNSPFQLKFNAPSPTATENTCMFIRSYIFERRDGEAPVMTGETVCTPSKANTLRRARKSGAKFVPLAF